MSTEISIFTEQGFATTMKARFFAKVDREQGQCWIWTGAKNNKGYGVFFWTSGLGNRMKLAHRVSWALRHGHFPDGHLLHRCDNPLCVRPGHLAIGTQADNLRDMTAKGRRRNGVSRGEKNGRARLTRASVAAIRRLHATGMSCAKLGKKFSVSASTAHRAAVGRYWS